MANFKILCFMFHHKPFWFFNQNILNIKSILLFAREELVSFISISLKSINIFFYFIFSRNCFFGSSSIAFYNIKLNKFKRSSIIHLAFANLELIPPQSLHLQLTLLSCKTLIFFHVDEMLVFGKVNCFVYFRNN